MLSIHLEAVAPYQLEILLQSKDASINLLNATAAAFEVEREDDSGGTVEWAATLSGHATVAAGTQVKATHVYTTGDLPNVEKLRVRARVTVTGLAGPVYSKPFPVLVKGKFDG